MVRTFHYVQIQKNSHGILRKGKEKENSVYDSNLVKNGQYNSICVND